MNRSILRAALAVASLSSLAALAVATPPALATPATRVVARGLQAPKYLTFGPGGLYVTESGRGGSRCVRGVAGETLTRVCAGDTGSILRLSRRGPKLAGRRLPSASVASTHEVSGVTAVAFTARHMVVLFNDGGTGPTGVSGIAAPYGARFGKLDLATGLTGGRLHAQADIAAFQATHPQSPSALGGLPGETLWDTDPHDLVAWRGGFAVADAGANDVVFVSRGGRVSLLARLPTIPELAPAGALGPGSPPMLIHAQAVPSSVAVGPRGALYVGLLSGIPALPGTAEVDRIVPGQAPVPVVTGLTRVSDLAFDPAGRLDILESSVTGGGVATSAAGALLQATLTRSGPATAVDLDVPGLRDPVGLAIDRTGTAYITNDTEVPGRGEVLAVSLGARS